MKNGLIVNSGGDKEWYLNGKLHREDGPAIEYVDGDKEWWLNGQRHREDGPAIELYFYDIDKRWWLNGKEYTQEEHWELTHPYEFIEKHNRLNCIDEE